MGEVCPHETIEKNSARPWPPRVGVGVCLALDRRANIDMSTTGKTPPIWLKRAIGVTLATTLTTACSSSNYAFDALTKVRGQSRSAELAAELTEIEGDKPLYDVTYVPLAHLDLHVYGPTDEDDDCPDGFVEANVQSALPLFGFVDGSLDKYDENHELYEHQEFESYFWGLFQRYNEEVATPQGLRRKRKSRILWILDWGGSTKYVEAPKEGSA